MKDPIKADLKRIKDAYMAPMAAFEGRVKGIIGIIDTARDDIDAQFKAGEKAFKDGRRAALQKEYEAVAGPVADLIPLESFIETEWLAPKRSEEWACGKLADKAAEALDAYSQIMKLDLPFKDEAVARFCETLSFVEAIKRNSELEEERARMEEFRAAQAAVAAQGSRAGAGAGPHGRTGAEPRTGARAAADGRPHPGARAGSRLPLVAVHAVRGHPHARPAGGRRPQGPGHHRRRNQVRGGGAP